jgi:hypothetical protein
MDLPTTRRRLCTAAAALTATATTASASSGSGSGDDDDDDCTKTCGANQTTQCPFDNEIEIRTEYGAQGQRVWYQIKVDGELELPNGQRRRSTTGTLIGHRSRERSCTFKYAGTLRCLTVKGPGSAHIHQPEPCSSDH